MDQPPSARSSQIDPLRSDLLHPIVWLGPLVHLSWPFWFGPLCSAHFASVFLVIHHLSLLSSWLYSILAPHCSAPSTCSCAISAIPTSQSLDPASLGLFGLAHSGRSASAHLTLLTYPRPLGSTHFAWYNQPGLTRRSAVGFSTLGPAHSTRHPRPGPIHAAHSPRPTSHGSIGST